jgi:patatin-like phospholipase/acyl hydrolase
MELIILLKLEGYIREAGLKGVKISDMFDLIIGTSTGSRPICQNSYFEPY